MPSRTPLVSFLLLWLAIAACGISCESSSADDTGGETHFLRLCQDDPSACGTSLACLCGVCTTSCQANAACSAYPGAACTLRAAEFCDSQGPKNVCEVSCASDQACAQLSPEHRCQGGVCRLDEVGGGGAGTGGSAACSTGEVAPNEVLIVGDSFFATTHEVTGHLEALAREAGALAPGERYRDASRLANNALAHGGEGILDEYLTAVADASARVVIMNGGGADVLLGTCDPVVASCPMILEASEALARVLEAMAGGGIEAVLFVAYPDPQPSAVREKMDLLRPHLETRCAESPVPCHLVDLRPVFAGSYDEYIQPAGLNPTTAGSEATARAIWDVLRAQCIAQ